MFTGTGSYLKCIRLGEGRMSKFIRVGDQVGIIAGNDKGKMGTVLKCMTKKVVVQGINIRKKHQKARSQEEPSQIIELEKPINKSNVMIAINDTKWVKLRLRINKEGSKELYYLDGQNEVLYRPLKKQSKQ